VPLAHNKIAASATAVQGLSVVCENYVYNKNDVIPSRFSGEGPCVLPWSFMELRNARSLGQSPRDDDLRFSHAL
jgi:hypothetical protein